MNPPAHSPSFTRFVTKPVTKVFFERRIPFLVLGHGRRARGTTSNKAYCTKRRSKRQNRQNPGIHIPISSHLISHSYRAIACLFPDASKQNRFQRQLFAAWGPPWKRRQLATRLGVGTLLWQLDTGNKARDSISYAPRRPKHFNSEFANNPKKRRERAPQKVRFGAGVARKKKTMTRVYLVLVGEPRPLPPRFFFFFCVRRWE